MVIFINLNVYTIYFLLSCNPCKHVKLIYSCKFLCENFESHYFDNAFTFKFGLGTMADIFNIEGWARISEEPALFYSLEGWCVFDVRSKKVKLATVVEGDQKAPFSIATTQRCWGGRYSFPLIAPLYPLCVPNIDEYYARRYQVPFLKSLVWRNLGLNPGLLDHWRILYPLIF